MNGKNCVKDLKKTISRQLFKQSYLGCGLKTLRYVIFSGTEGDMWRQCKGVDTPNWHSNEDSVNDHHLWRQNIDNVQRQRNKIGTNKKTKHVGCWQSEKLTFQSENFCWSIVNKFTSSCYLGPAHRHDWHFTVGGVRNKWTEAASLPRWSLETLLIAHCKTS